MTVHVIVDIGITDPEGYRAYAKLALETVKLFDGKCVARGSVIETLEGEWQARQLVILEFQSAGRARALNSSEYAPACALRRQYAKSNMVVVEGL